MLSVFDTCAFGSLAVCVCVQGGSMSLRKKQNNMV